MWIVLWGLIPPYQGTDYTGAINDMPIQRDGAAHQIVNMVGPDARCRLRDGTYRRQQEWQDVIETCCELFEYFPCAIQTVQNVVQKKLESHYMCQGCPYCTESPCFIWPCDSGNTLHPHRHQGDDIWFPEKTGCPFVLQRQKPLVIRPEQRETVVRNTCAVYERDAQYTLVSTRQDSRGGHHRLYRRAGRNTCGRLERKGCVKKGCRCKAFAHEYCVHWECDYQCRQKGERIIPSPTFDCQEGQAPSEPPNGQMAQAITMLEGVGSGAQMAYGEPDNIRVFRGQAMGCHIDMVNFRDCCKEMDGWGKHLGFGCRQEERDLARMRQEKRCIYVGAYTSEYILGVEARKKKVFCCFPNAVVRAIRQHAQKQLGHSWGAPQHPNCLGLRVYGELDQVDFSSIDAKEIECALRTKGAKVDYDVLRQKVQGVLSRMGRDC